MDVTKQRELSGNFLCKCILRREECSSQFEQIFVEHHHNDYAIKCSYSHKHLNPPSHQLWKAEIAEMQKSSVEKLTHKTKGFSANISSCHNCNYYSQETCSNATFYYQTGAEQYVHISSSHYLVTQKKKQKVRGDLENSLEGLLHKVEIENVQ